MPRKKKEIKESSTTTQIKGFLAPAGGSGEVKKQKKETPWYLKTMKEVRDMVIEDLSGRRLLSEAPKTSNPQEYIRDIEKEIAGWEDARQEDPGDDTPVRHIRSLRRQIEKAKQAVELGGENWRDYLVDPKSQHSLKQAQHKEKVAKSPASREMPRKYEDFAKQLLSQQVNNIPPEKRQIFNKALEYLKKYVGMRPATQGDLEKIESWIENRLIKQHDGSLEQYIASRKGAKVNLSKRGPQGKMSTKTGKRGAPMPADARMSSGQRDKGPDMPGAQDSMQKLFNKLEQDPEHEKSKFSSPGGSGAGYDPGAAGNILKKIYKKIIQGVIDPKDLDKVDPEALGVKKNDFTEFEKALGPYLRDLYAKDGHEIDPSEKEKPTFQSGAAEATKGMKLVLSRRLGVGINDVDDKADEIKEKNPEAWAKIESSALEDLKKLLPGDFKKEMEMRSKRQRHQGLSQEEEDELRRKEVRKRIAKIKDTPSREKIVHSPEGGDHEEEEDSYHKTASALDRLSSRKKVPTKDDSTKSQRRAHTRSFTEPRSPEVVAKRREMEPEFQAAASLRQQKREKVPRRELINKQLGVGEAMEFKLEDFFAEGFENSYGIDENPPEQEWEDGEPTNKKDWSQTLSLESLMNSLTESPLDKNRKTRGSDPQKWLDCEGEESEEMKTMNVPDGWGKGNEPSAWLAVGKHAGDLEDNEREEE